jgi:exonuclease III
MHVIAVQELHADLFRVVQLRNEAAKFSYHMYYSICTRNSAQAGVAVLVARSVATGVDTDSIFKDDSGRILFVPLTWRGHRLVIINCYVPNDPQEARQFMQHVVGPALAETGGRQPVLLGDFNFVTDVRLDRVRTSDTAAARTMARTPSDAACARTFSTQVAPDMVDTFRRLHPAQKGMSFFGPHGAARLDRVYVHESLMACVTSSAIATVGGSFSDHRAAVVHISPSASDVGAASRTRTTRCRRVRMWFWDCSQLRSQFSEWLSAQCTAAPEDPTALLLWWPNFKCRLAAFVVSLNIEHRRQALTPVAMQDRREAARVALDAAHAALEGGAPDGQQRVVQAKREWAASLNEVQRHERLHGASVEWVHPNERPSPAFTAVVSPPKYATVVQALQHPRGHLVGPGRGQADVMVQHYASISEAKPCDHACVQSVIAAVKEHGPVGLPNAEVDMLGDMHVSEDEVLSALKRCPSGRSPGLDGIPVELYRRGSRALAPLLARVYSAMGETGQVPCTLLDGLITSLHKSGSRTDPANYRPITLLNTDYRVLAKVLVNRLLRCAGGLISAEQSAFLRDRHIGDGVMLLQLLPHATALQRHEGAVVAFMDFKKAYDTVSRPFLLAVLREYGLGEGFVKWVSMVLSDTRACATVNGYMSRKVLFGAGVRQGCPLAPVLYLFVAESLLRFLKAQDELGLLIAGRKLLANQFADDMQVFLRSVRQVQYLVQAMGVFERASGQGLNLGKSSLLPIGRPHSDTPAPMTMVQGIPVRENAKALGFSFACGMQSPKPADGWDVLLQRVDAKIRRLARLPLSPFGRAVGASSYAVSKLLYHVEFLDTLSEMQIAELQRLMAHLVDRKLGTGFTHVPHECLLGPAKQGGFGVLSLRHHIAARRAVWAVRLLSGDGTKPWVAVGRHILASKWGEAPWQPMLPLHASGQSPRESHFLGGVALAPPLARIIHALQQMPPPTPGAAATNCPSFSAQWCASMPIMGNPLLVNAGGEGLQGDALDFACIGAHTLGRVLIMDKLLAEHGTDSAWEHCGPWRALAYDQAPRWRDRCWVRERVDHVLAFVPAQWQTAARSCLHNDTWPYMPHACIHVVGAEYLQVANAILHHHLFWPQPTTRTPPVPMPMLGVRQASTLLMQPVAAARAERWRGYLAEAMGIVPAELPGDMIPCLYGLFAKLWKLGWHNERKVVFWRMCVNGLPFASRFNTGKSCVCSAAAADNPGRLHHFWHCEAAQAVIGELQRGLQCSNIALERRHVWLMEVPAEVDERYGNSAVVRQLWRVVCLSALNAMWHYTCHVMAASPAVRDALQQQAEGSGVGSHIAVAHFRGLLEEFARVGRPPKAWHRLLPADAPFFRYSSDRELQVVNMPQAV